MTTSRAHNQANTTVATYAGDSAPIWGFVNEILTARKRHNQDRGKRTMAFELREGQGSAFVNPDKEKGENYPDFKGKIKLSAEIVAMAAKNGNVVGIAAWKKMTRSGDSMLSFELGKPFVPQRQGQRGNDQEVGEEPF